MYWFKLVFFKGEEENFNGYLSVLGTGITPAKSSLNKNFQNSKNLQRI